MNPPSNPAFRSVARTSSRQAGRATWPTSTVGGMLITVKIRRRRRCLKARGSAGRRCGPTESTCGARRRGTPYTCWSSPPTSHLQQSRNIGARVPSSPPTPQPSSLRAASGRTKDWPSDVRVPWTDLSFLALSMGENVRLTIGNRWMDKIPHLTDVSSPVTP